MFQWLKSLIHIVKYYPEQQKQYQRELDILRRQINTAVQLIKDRTELNIDTGYRPPSTVVLIGRYKNADYVQLYDIPQETFEGIVDELRYKSKFANINKVDGPIEFRCVIDKIKQE